MSNLLIVDDERIIRSGLSSIDWASCGVRLLAVASNGSEAMEVIRNETVDILLSDIRMPDMDGLELAENLLREQPKARIVFLTGYAEFAYVHKALRLGAVEYILKPALIPEIRNAVIKARDALEHRQTETEIPDDPSAAGEEFYLNAWRPVLEYIVRNYAEEISLSKLAEQFHFSPSYLSKSIKKATGYSFVQFLTAIRVYYAGIALRNSNKKISEICMDVGLPNEQYFSQLFRNYFGVTPNAYRKHQEAETPASILRFLEASRLLLGENPEPLQ